jgi:hypothetical protein
MAKLGTKKRPIRVQVASEERAYEVAAICAEHNWHYIMKLADDEEAEEDMTELEQALASLGTAPSKPKLTASAIPSRKKKRKK